jgi:hypothetical protein
MFPRAMTMLARLLLGFAPVALAAEPLVVSVRGRNAVRGVAVPVTDLGTQIEILIRRPCGQQVLSPVTEPSPTALLPGHEVRA